MFLPCSAGFAEFERELIMARTGEGRLRAKARGVPSPLHEVAVLSLDARPLQGFDDRRIAQELL